MSQISNEKSVLIVKWNDSFMICIYIIAFLLHEDAHNSPESLQNRLITFGRQYAT